MQSSAIVIALVVFTFIDALGCGMVLSALPFFALDQGLNPMWLMVMFTSYSVGQVLGMPGLAILLHHVGHKSSLVIVLAGSAMSFFGLSFASGVQGLVLLRGFHGLINGSVMLSQICILCFSHPGHHAENLGRLTAAMNTGASVGAALGAWLFRLGGFPRVASTASFICAVNTLICGIGFVEFAPQACKGGEVQQQQSGLGPLQLLGLTGIPCIYSATFLQFFGFAMFDAMAAIYARELFDAGAVEVGIISGVSGLLCLAFQIRWMQPFVELAGDAGGFALGHLGRVCMYIGLIARVPRCLAATLIVAGMLCGQIATTCVASLIGCRTPAHLTGVAVGSQQSLGALGRFLGPIMAGIGYKVDHLFPLISTLLLSVLAAALGNYLSVVSPYEPAASGVLHNDSERSIVSL